ncbi:MAG TPA: Uma2 family endonuclease [Acidimicrobiales bacterium]|nr:Uma2 family endonuclease [Acidimicrobiales bacterium]
MRTVVLGPPPPELDALIARRRSLGLDTHDEVWKGEYHMAPAAHASHGWLDDQLAVLLHPLARAAGLGGTGPFNLGQPDDFRVPDRGLHRQRPHALWVPTAAVVIEIESPDDETCDKLDFYADHGVDELLIVSAEARSVTWLVLTDGRYQKVEESRLLGPESGTLADRIEWPAES